MKRIFFSLVMVNLISYLESAKRFRCDYTYKDKIRGYVKYHEMPSTWDDAQLRCRLEGAMLMSPISPDFKLEMMSHANKSRVCGIFTGLHAKYSKGDFNTIDGIRLAAFQHEWAREEPNNMNDQESCITMLPEGTIADVQCNETLPYVCYRKLDNDVKDFICGPDKGYGYCKSTSKCYKLHTYPRAWSRAYMTCSAENGHLAIINTVVETEIFKQMFKKMHARRAIQTIATFAFLGFRDWGGELRTIHGQTLEEAGYDRFSGQVGNKTQTCGGVDQSATLVTLSCEQEFIFICEKQPEAQACAKLTKI